MQVDYGYSSHRRVVRSISGMTVKGHVPFVRVGPTPILENRVNGVLRTVTVLDSISPRAKAVARLDAWTARY